MGRARREAEDSAAAAGVEVRPLTTLEEAGQAVHVMVATWGNHQLVPRELLRAFQASGNVLLGAFDGKDMVGFVLGFYGADPEGFHHHSHMLATLPERRRSGVGLALKLAQRAAVLEAGVDVVRWTFDPMIARNAHFNLNKLGVVADAFHRHFYGDMPDVINRGERSDRLEVRWDLLRAPGPHQVPAVPLQVLVAREGDEELPRPSAVGRLEAGAAAVEVPRDHEALRARDRGLASAWRDAVAEALRSCFDAGLSATAFLPEGAYLLTVDEAPPAGGGGPP